VKPPPKRDSTSNTLGFDRAILQRKSWEPASPFRLRWRRRPRRLPRAGYDARARQVADRVALSTARRWKPGIASSAMTSSPLAKLHFTDVTEQADSRTSPTAWAQPSAITTTMAFPISTSPTSDRIVLYRNNGNGTFTDVTREAGVDDPRWSRAPLRRYDKDGLLDLYVANYLDFTVPATRTATIPRPARLWHPARLPPRPDRLFRNLGTASFRTSASAPASAPPVAPDSASSAPTSTATAGRHLRRQRHAANLLWINQAWHVPRRRPASRRRLRPPTAWPAPAWASPPGDFDGDGYEDLLVTSGAAALHEALPVASLSASPASRIRPLLSTLHPKTSPCRR